MSASLAIDGLSVSVSGRGQKPRRILDGIGFCVEAGTATALVGESGSGKTTLARAVAGLCPIDAGSIRLSVRGEELDLRRLRSPEGRLWRRHLQMVLQDPGSSLDPRIPILDSIAEPLLALGLEGRKEGARARARNTATELGLDPELLRRRPHALSGGQRQRAALARALVVDPALLILDEATSALDQSLKAQVLNLLVREQEKRAITMLVITHDLTVAATLTDRTVVLWQGRVVEEENTARLLQDPGHPYTRALRNAVLPPDPAAARRRIQQAAEARERSPNGRTAPAGRGMP